MPARCLILADPPEAFIQLCGISVLERCFRSLQRCGIKQAIVISSAPTSNAQELASPSWARADLDLTIRARPGGQVTMEQLLDLWPDGAELSLIISADSVFDQRLLRRLISHGQPAALVDSAVPVRLEPLVTAAPNTTRGRLCGLSLLQFDWVRSRSGPLAEALQAGLEDGTLAPIDVATEPVYYASLNRELRPYWFPAPTPARASLAKRVLLDSAQKGTLDLPATVLHSWLETLLISQLCETSITPNQLTIVTNVVAWSATILLATGHLGWGLALAVAVGVLDGLDGKQARVKVETTKAGKLEHLFDAFFELSWWIALAFYFQRSTQIPGAFRYLALFLLAQGLDAIIKNGVRAAVGKSIEELGPFERFVHLIGGRRNVFVWLMTIGFLLGAPARAFIVMTWLAVATVISHLPRALSLFLGRRRSSQA